MANDFSANPWYIDTVMPTAINQNCRLSSVTWSEQTAAGDQLVIVDRNGKIIIDTKAQSANYQQVLGGFGWVAGFKVTVLTSGKLSIVISKA